MGRERDTKFGVWARHRVDIQKGRVYFFSGFRIRLGKFLIYLKKCSYYFGPEGVANRALDTIQRE